MPRKIDKIINNLCPSWNHENKGIAEAKDDKESGYKPLHGKDTENSLRRSIEERGYKSWVYGELSQEDKDAGIEYAIPTPKFLACASAVFIMILSLVLWRAGTLYMVLSSLLEKTLELSYVVALIIPFAGKYGRDVEKKYGEFGVITLLRAEIRREVRCVSEEMEQMVQAIPGHVRSEMKEIPHQVQHAAKEAFSTGVNDLKDFQNQLDSKFHDIEHRLKHTMEALPALVRAEMIEIQAHIKELPGRVKHAAEEAGSAIVSEVTSVKQHFIESEQNLVQHIKQLPAEVELLIKAQLHNVMHSMQGMTDSMQSEFSLVKSHVTGLKDHVSQKMRSATSICGTVSREEAVPA